ncbi:restriction endonuclease subunit S [Catenibacterium sp.]|uniref:restriction endonuclease subunit S n=1 Tax=Catenibacterium sp. TaxID=2049022 RepID=UPI003AB4E8A4
MEYKKLGDIATYINGYAFKPEQRGSEGLPIIRIQDLTGNAYDLGYYNGDYPKKIELNDGDVLISWSASLGVYLWNRGKALLNQHIFKVVFDKVEINKFYFMYAVEYNLDKMSLKTHGATMKHITKKDFDNVVIPYPDLDYQKEVAYRLTSLKGIIEKYQKQLDLLDELVKARFVEMFGDENNSKGWEIVNIEDVANVQVGVVIKPSQYYTDQYNGIKAFRSLNIGNGYIKDDDWVYFSKEGNKKNKKSILSTNDVLVVRSGAPGTACVVTSKYAGSNAIDVIIAHPDFQKVDSHYLCTYTNMPHGKSQIIEGTGGAAQQHFNVGKYNKLKLMLPPLEYQKQYVKFLEEIDKSRLLNIRLKPFVELLLKFRIFSEYKKSS